MKVLWSVSACVLWAIALLAPASIRAAPPATAPAGDFYQRLSDAYFQGKWDDLAEDLKKTRELAALPAAQQADVTYLRQALGECRQAWWKPCKAGQKGVIRPIIWGRTLGAQFDPEGKGGLQIQFVGQVMAVTFSWSVADMENPAHAEHGFSKGELCDLGIWANLGMGASWAAQPLSTWTNLKDDDKALFQRYLDFRGNVTGVYYASPRARRWGLFLYLLTYLEKYAKMPIVNARKAVSATFVAEVVSHPGRYPSLKLPATLAADRAEEKLALHLKDWIEKHGWTLAEDKAIREAMKALAAANDKPFREMVKIALPNKLTLALDPDQDAGPRAERDAWVKAQFDKAGK